MTLILSSSLSYPHLHFFTQTLTTLNLGYNQIGAVGAQHLAGALRNNTVTLILSSSLSYPHLHFFTQTLTTRYLAGNKIGDNGAESPLEVVGNGGYNIWFLLGVESVGCAQSMAGRMAGRN